MRKVFLRLLPILAFLALLSCKSDISTVLINLPVCDPWVDSKVQTVALDGTDILWVLDRSCSMTDNRDRMVDGISEMVAALPSGGWRLMIIPASGVAVQDHDLFPIVPGDDLGQIVDMIDQLPTSSTPNNEEGFKALQNYVDDNPSARLWMRQDAAFLTVFVSDEDEQSQIDLFDFYDWFASRFLWGYVTSIVHIPGSEICHVEQIGTRYIAMANRFDGTIVDICEDSWAPGISQAVDQLKPFDELELTFWPALWSIRVLISGELAPEESWFYSSATNSVVFLEVPPPGELVEAVYNLDPDTYGECNGRSE